MTKLQGQSAVVIGGESGIGRAISEALAAEGATVHVAGILEDAGQATVEAIAAAGGTSRFSRLDVRDTAAISAAIQQGCGPDGALHILVYSAGVFDGFVNCQETEEQVWDQVMAINLKGCYLACKAALGHMVPRQYGRIIGIGSVASHAGGADGFPYTVSKHGMLGMFRNLSTSYAGQGIAANIICPGVFATDIRNNSSRILGDKAPDMNKGVSSVPDAYKALVPAHRRGELSEVGALAAFLASRDAGYINGESIAIDGGWLAK